MPKKKTPIADRFWPKVAKAGPDDCWLWTACHNGVGYGVIGRGGAGEGMMLAHRFAWEYAYARR